MLTDTHCHLTYPGLFENVAAVLQRARDAGVTRIVTIGTHVGDHQKTLSVATASANASRAAASGVTPPLPPGGLGTPGGATSVGGYGGVFAALGIHPHHAGETEEGYEGFLKNALAHERVVALGECGLDYHYDYCPKLLQKGVFINQLELARQLALPVILHVREAHADALDIVNDFPELTFVVHCFTGTPDECRRWLALPNGGAYIGLTGIVTYKNATDVVESAKIIPPDRLLVETDAPYLSPEPVRKVKTNEPAHVAHTARFLAELRGVTFEQLAQQTTENALRFYGPKLRA